MAINISGRSACAVSRLRLVLAVSALCIASGIGAQPLDLARVPLVVNATLPPNMIVTFDDSGSMAFGWTPDAIEFADIPRQVNNPARPTICFYRTARYYSPDYNAQYYDPNITYRPPINAAGEDLPNQNYTTAQVNGYSGTATRNLSNNYFVTFWDGMGNSRDNILHATGIGATGTGISRFGNHNQCTGVNADVVRNVQNKTATFPFGSAGFYCRWTGAANPTPAMMLDNSQFQCVNVNNESAAQRQNFANWFSYYRMRGHTAKAAVSRAFDSFDSSARVTWQNLNANQIGNATRIAALEGTRRTNFYSWLFNSPYSGGTPLRASTVRAGNFLEQEWRQGLSDTRNPFWDERYDRSLSCRQNFHLLVTDGYTNEADNPSAPTGNVDKTAITSLPDLRGFSITAAESRVIWNEPNAAGGGCGSAGCRPTLADIAFYYWARDLAPDLDNDVPPYLQDYRRGVTGPAGGAAASPLDVPEIYWNPANNPATWQHMVNFIIGFGVTGTLPYNDDPSSPLMTRAQRLLRLRRGDDQWPAMQNNHPTTIDDAWHAAINSRGDYLGAQNPQELVDALTAVLDNVSRRQGQSSSSGSSVFLRSGEFEYSASYNSGDWTGDIVANPLGDATPWSASAGAQLNDRTEPRQIFTWRPGTTPGTGEQVPFEFGALSPEQQLALQFNPETGEANDGLGADRVAFLAGDRELEQSAGGPFRDRTSLLGSVVGSNIRYVEAPAQGYSGRPGFPEGGGTYSEFRQDNVERSPMLYVGANDGMLHAINARTGREEWAFVPNKVVRNLSRLTPPGFQFVPTVDGRLYVQDVYLGGPHPSGRWATILIGTLGLGGQGAFAIDITDPSSPRVMWELGDEHESQLGFNYGELPIVRMFDGDAGIWAALVPSGYNNSDREDRSVRGLPFATQDENYSDDGEALFVVDIETGSILHRLDNFPGVANPAYGIGPVTAAEYGNNFQTSLAVAGDLNGNLWRFDLDLRSDDFGQIQRVYRGSPERPITSAPRVFPDRGEGLVFVFGTGKYLELTDRELSAADTRQALFGIKECRICGVDYPATLADLRMQELVEVNDGFLSMERAYLVQPEQRGWYVELGNPLLYDGLLVGERIIRAPVAEFASGAIFATSFVPSDDPCSPQGGNVLYALSAYNGGFVFPGDLNNSDPDNPYYVPGNGVFPEPGDDEDVGAIFVPGITPPFPDGPGGVDGLGQPRVDGNGCFSIGSIATQVCIVPRRRGWRENPLN